MVVLRMMLDRVLKRLSNLTAAAARTPGLTSNFMPAQPRAGSWRCLG